MRMRLTVGVLLLGLAALVPLPAEAVGSWKPTGSLAAARGAGGLAMLPDGRVLAIGGGNNTPAHLASVEAWDPATGIWIAEPPMTTPREELATVTLLDGRVMAIGGLNNGAYLASAE